MKKTRTQKATLNLTTTAAYEVITFASGLILPRLILRNYGSAYNGIISSISQFLSLVSILRLGVAGATRVALYKTLARNDIKGTSSIVKATELYMRKIGIVILVYIFLLSIIFPFLLKSEYGFLNVALLVIAAGLGTFAQYFFGITYQTFLTADQSIYIYNTIQSLCTIANTIISIFLVLHGFSIQVVKYGSALVFVITPILLSVYVNKRYNLDKKCEPDNKALSQKRDVMATSIANIIHHNTDIIILTLFCDIKVVSVYSVYNLVMIALKKIQDVFTSGVESVFGDMWAKEEYGKVSKYLNLFEFIIGSFISVTFSCTFLLLLPFVSLYTKGVTDIDYCLPVYAAVISTAQAFFCFRTPYLVLVQGAGRYKETKYGSYAEAVINLVLSILLVRQIGIVGTAIGTLAANLFRSIQYSLYIDKKMIRHRFSIVIKRLLWICVNISFCCLLFSHFTSFVSKGWEYWVGGAIILSVVSMAITLLSGYVLFRKDYNNLIELTKRIRLRKVRE